MRSFLFLILILLLTTSSLGLAACGSGNDVSLPVKLFQSDASNLPALKCVIIMNRASVVFQGNPPSKPVLHLEGSLPSSCSDLQVKINPPDSKNQINVRTASDTDAALSGDSAFKPFSVYMEFPQRLKGKYSLWVNGKQWQDFTVP